jgi:gliding motility-associated protein GldE
LFAIKTVSATIAGELLLIVFLLCCSALVSAAEAAFFSVAPNTLNALRSDQQRSSQTILKLLERPRRLLATFLIANTMTNIAVVILVYLVLSQIIDFENNTIAELLFNGAVATSLILLIGEVLPKIYASQRPMQVARMMAGPTSMLVTLFSPVCYVMVQTAKWLERRLHRQPETAVTLEEMNHAIDLTVGEKTTAQELNLLKSIVKFGNIQVSQAMRPRLDMICISSHADFAQLLQVANESGYSRLPVISHDADHITGIMFTKDLIAHLHESASFNWRQLQRAPLFVPETKKIDDLLKQFQTSRMHMAIVVDEYGGTLGLITLEDILEEVIGEIQDEFDEETETIYQRIDDSTYVFDGKTPLTDVARITGLRTAFLDQDNSETATLAGLVLQLAGRIPSPGERLRAAGCTFTVMNVGDNRVRKVKLKIATETTTTR